MSGDWSEPDPGLSWVTTQYSLHCNQPRVGWALGKSSIGLGTPGNPNIRSTYVCLCCGYAIGCKTKHFSYTLLIKTLVKYFSQPKDKHLLKIAFVTHHYFLGIFHNKTFGDRISKHIDLFLMVVFPFFPLNKLFISFSNILATRP